MSPNLEPKKKRSMQWGWFFTTLIIGLGCIYYVFLQKTNLQNSAALYIGLPMLLALGLSLTPKTKSVLGTTMKAITIALILSAILFREGYICIFFAAPIFYFVGAVIGVIIDIVLKRMKKRSTIHASGIAVFIFMLFSLEGVTDLLTWPRFNEIKASKVVNANIADIRAQLAKTPQLGPKKPFFLKIFPYPVNITGEGLDIGDERIVKFIAYKHIWWNKIEGDLRLKIAQYNDNHVQFEIVSDTSYLDHYLKWRSSDVSLESLDENHTQVTWTLTYDRIYDPAWYFGPMQRYAVKLAAQELIDHVATPS